MGGLDGRRWHILSEWLLSNVFRVISAREDSVLGNFKIERKRLTAMPLVLSCVPEE